MIDRGYITRAVLLLLLLLLAWTGLAVRLGYLHLGSNERLQARVEQIRKVEQEILVGRGRILDARNNIMALDLSVRNVCVDPLVILSNQHARVVGFHLARLLQLDPAVVMSRINRPGRRYECVKRFVQDDVADHILKLQLAGVFFEDASTRYYPQGTLMCHVLGFSNMEGVGSAGVEQRLNLFLKGRPGLLVSEKDGHRRELYSRRSLAIDPQQGADVYLTLDQNVQYILEKALDAAMQEHQALAVWAIVERVRTGEILAMASRPDYDLNEFRTATEPQRLNRCIGVVYEPGSIFKVAVIAAALNEGTVTPETLFDCENGAWHYRGRLLRDFHPYGILSVADIIKKSSNIGAAKVALTLGEARLEKYLRAFGIGQLTGIELPGEEAGILRNHKYWTPLSISRIPMGHEVAVTALQMVNLLCGVANDGFLMKPMLVRRVVDTQGHVLAEYHPEVVARPITEKTAAVMRRLLQRVTEEGGTGAKACVEGYSVGGKTGTAQKAIPGGYSDSQNVASFMGFLPVENPELAVIVVVDEPQPLHTGGQVSAPIFAGIARQLVKYLDIPPLDAQTMSFLKDEQTQTDL